jgi:hypothetical protein
MITVFSMEDGSAELENVDILAPRDEAGYAQPVPSLQLLTVAESEMTRARVPHRLAACD